MEKKKPIAEHLKRKNRRNTIQDALPMTFPVISSVAQSMVQYVPAKPVRRAKSDPPPSTLSAPVSRKSGVETIPDLQFEPDYNIMSERVIGLNQDNFNAFVRSKEKALVMFYKNFQSENIDFDVDFASTAEGSTNERHGYAAVDCCANRELCANEKVCCTPVLKLYSNGFEVGNIISASKISAAQMNMMVKMTPILTKPKVNLNATADTCQTSSRRSSGKHRASLLW